MSSRPTAPLLVFLLSVAGANPARSAEPPGHFRGTLQPLLTAYCVGCHGAAKPKGGVRLDAMAAPDPKDKEALALWVSVYEQMDRAQMPPADSKQPPAEALAAALEALQLDLARAGAAVARSTAREFPDRGNVVDHEVLFTRPTTAAAATPSRVWRLSPFAYREFADDLTAGRLIVQGGPSVRAKQIPLAPAPFGLTTDHGFRDYAFRYQVSGSESQQLAMNAKVILDGMLARRARYTPPKELTDVAAAGGKPSDAAVRAAVRFLFGALLHREPAADELEQGAAFVHERVARHGNREGLVLGLVPVFLHPEAVFRSELGAGEPDRHGRLMLAPTELAVAISYALTDSRPDSALLGAARSGKLATREDARREVTRLLDSATEKPRILRFFQEYFDYDRAGDVFKDPADLKKTELYDFARHGAARLDARLPAGERDKFRPFLEGHEEAGTRRRELLKMADVLARHAPKLDDKFHKPRFETDWWDASLSVGIGALASGVTNVLTIASGLCTVAGTWTGWGATTTGHTLGHTSQLENPDWLKIRRASLEMLVRVMKALEAVPEGRGTMMDNTLIVYTSCAGESQHSTGNRWPFLLLGDLGGTLRAGRFVHYPLEPHAKSRTVNALYATLLHAAGAPRDRFNLDGALKDLDRAGPLPELLR
jgi:hypothetical protein